MSAGPAYWLGDSLYAPKLSIAEKSASVYPCAPSGRDDLATDCPERWPSGRSALQEQAETAEGWPRRG